MNPKDVCRQISNFIERLISSSLSIKQFEPSVRGGEGGSFLIGRRQSSGIALRDIAYDDVYREIESNDAYDVKLVDGGLLIFQYRFDNTEALMQHRLAYFPNPILPTVDEAPALYEQDELYGDIIARRLVRFPIRFDYAPSQQRDMIHPASHLTLGQYENCRIPVVGPMGPNSFGTFIIRNFYCRAYTRNKNKFDRRMPLLDRIETISVAEQRISHFVHSR